MAQNWNTVNEHQVKNNVILYTRVHTLCTCNEKVLYSKAQNVIYQCYFSITRKQFLSEDFDILCQSFPPTFHTYLSIQPCTTSHNWGCKTNCLSLAPLLQLTIVIRWQR